MTVLEYVWVEAIMMVFAAVTESVRVGTCSMGTCQFGNCAEGKCPNTGYCVPTTSVCCYNGQCLPGVSMTDCKNSGANNPYTDAGICPNFCNGSTNIMLSTFNAVYNDDKKSVEMMWRLTPEMVDQDFYIERSRNGVRFNDIGYLDKSAMVDSSFSFSDITPFQVGYYRLYFTLNGRQTYSQTLTVIGVNTGQLVLIPNPATGNVRVLLTNMQLYNTAISITDLSGRLVLSRNLNSGQFELDISNLPMGVFVVRAQQNGKIFTGKLVKN